MPNLCRHLTICTSQMANFKLKNRTVLRQMIKGKWRRTTSQSPRDTSLTVTWTGDHIVSLEEYHWPMLWHIHLCVLFIQMASTTLPWFVVVAVGKTQHMPI